MLATLDGVPPASPSTRYKPLCRVLNCSREEPNSGTPDDGCVIFRTFGRNRTVEIEQTPTLCRRGRCYQHITFHHKLKSFWANANFLRYCRDPLHMNHFSQSIDEDLEPGTIFLRMVLTSDPVPQRVRHLQMAGRSVFGELFYSRGGSFLSTTME